MRFYFNLLLNSRSCGGVVLGRLGPQNIARASAIPLITLVSLIARASVTLLAALLVTRVALIPTLFALGWWQRRVLALDFLGRTLKTAELLTKRLDLPLVGGLLAFSFFEQLEELVQLIEGLAQRCDDFHHFVDGLANGRRLRGLKGPEWRLRLAFLTLLPHRLRTTLARLGNGFDRLFV